MAETVTAVAISTVTTVMSVVSVLVVSFGAAINKRISNTGGLVVSVMAISGE